MPKSLADFVQEALREVDEVAPEDVGGLEGFTVLDVREPDEYAEGHIPGSLSFPRGFLEVRADLEHPKRDVRLADRSQPLVLVCGGGHRSALAARTLQEMGFERVLSLRGGMTAWNAAGLPTER